MNQVEKIRAIQDLALFFKNKGGPLTRREYFECEDRPYSTKLFERHILSWGRARAYAEMEMMGQNWIPEFLEEISEKEEKEKRDAPYTAYHFEEDDFEINYQLTRMTGLQPVNVHLRSRRALAELVHDLQKCLFSIPRWKIAAPSDRKQALLILISDCHFGKKVISDKGDPIFNKDIAVFRMDVLKMKILGLIREQLRSSELDEVYLCLLGDIVDGQGIYPTQELNQDLQAFHLQICLGTACIWDIIAGIREEFGLPVKVKAVRGNHGRQYKYAPAGNNFDYLVYQLLYLLAYQHDRKGVNVEYSPNTEYLNFKAKDQNIHMRHIAYPQAETAAGKARFGGWRQIHDWDVLLFGHLHHPNSGTYLEGHYFMNGTIVGPDDLSEHMAVGSRPSQLGIVLDRDEGVLSVNFLHVDTFPGDLKAEGRVADLLERYPMLNAPGLN